MPSYLHPSGVHQKEVKWLYVQGAGGETIIGELREAVVEGVSFSDKEASGQSPERAKEKKCQGKKQRMMVFLYNFLSAQYMQKGCFGFLEGWWIKADSEWP